MEILIEENKRGTLKLSSLVVRKFIYMLLTTDNYQVALDDINVVVLENNNITVEIKLNVDRNEDLIVLKSKINKMILKRINSVLNLVLLNTHLIFTTKSKKVETLCQNQ